MFGKCMHSAQSTGHHAHYLSCKKERKRKMVVLSYFESFSFYFDFSEKFTTLIQTLTNFHVYHVYLLTAYCSGWYSVANAWAFTESTTIKNLKTQWKTSVFFFLHSVHSFVRLFVLSIASSISYFRFATSTFVLWLSKWKSAA